MKKQKLALVVVLLLLCVGLAFSLTSCGDDDNIYTKDDVNSLIAELEAALTEKTTENQAAIASLKAEYTAKVAELEKANSDNESAIATLNASYTAKVAELEAADKVNADALAELKADYEADLAELQKADEDNTAAIESLTSTYESKVAELEASDKANADALAELKADYETDLAELQKADGDNKAAIESLTSTYESKVAELEASDKANTDALAALRTEYEADLAELQKADVDNKAAIDSLTSTYESKVAELVAVDKANADALAALRTEYEADLAELQKADADNTAAIESLTSTYESKVAELEASDKANADALAALRTGYEADLEELQKIDGENKAAIENLTSVYEGKVAELEANDKANADALDALRAEYEIDLAELQKSDSENKKAIENLTTLYNSKVLELTKADEENAQNIANLTKTHNEDVGKIEADIAKNTEAITAYNTELQGKIDALTAKYDAKVASIEEMIDALNATDTENSNRIATLEAQVSILLNPPSYTVTFDTDGAGEVASQTVEHGEKLVTPTEPTKDGYIFDGWYVDNEKWSFIGYTVSQNMTLTAKWHEAYDLSGITFNSAIFTYDGVEKTITIDGELPEELVVMYTSNKMTDAGESLAYAYIMDESGYVYTTLNAVLTIEKADLSFTMADDTFTYDGSAKKLSVKEEIPEGVKVVYENNAQINVGTYEVVAKISVNGNYNAVEDIKATLTIEKATPTVEVSHDSTNFTLSDTLILTANSTVKGEATLTEGQSLTLGTRSYNYIFTPYDANYNTVTGTVSITVFAEVRFFDIDGELLDVQYIEKGGYISDFTPIYSDNSGYSYTFKGWQMRNGYFSASSQVFANMTLTADYEKELITYTVIYHLNGGNAETALTETYTVLDTLSVPALSKVGYTFNGWSGNGIEDGTLSFEFDNVIGDREYTASFTPNVYTLKLNAKGGSSEASELEITYDEVVNIPTPYRFGYDFLGWYYSDTELVNGDLWSYAENIEVIAKWEESAIIKITTAEELASIAYRLDGNYVLMNDIDLQGAEWGVIGDMTTPFTGTFDGGGYTVSNFKISVAADYTGMFGASSGIIQNLAITNATITSGTTGASILVGYNSGTIYNCSVSGSVNKSTMYVGGLVAYSKGDITLSSSSAEVYNGTYTGGLVGYFDGAKIEKSYSDGSAEITKATATVYLGGLVGYAKGEFELIDSYSYATVNTFYAYNSSKVTEYVGGLVGYSLGTSDSYGIIIRCHTNNVVSVMISNSNYSTTASTAYLGGLVGYSSYVSYQESFTIGTTSASLDIGKEKYANSSSGREELCEYGNSLYMGGLVGKDVCGTFTNSYSSVVLSSDVYTRSYFQSYNFSNYHAAYAESFIGGLIGSVSQSTISKCYASSDITAKTSAFANYSSSNVYNRAYAYSYIGGLVGNSITDVSNVIDSYASILSLVIDTTASANTNYSSAVCKNSYGGMCGDSANITFTNCYRYSGTESNVEIGTPTSLANLQSVNFITETLGWDMEIWTLENGQYPKLELYEKE